MVPAIEITIAAIEIASVTSSTMKLPRFSYSLYCLSESLGVNGYNNSYRIVRYRQETALPA